MVRSTKFKEHTTTITIEMVQINTQTTVTITTIAQDIHKTDRSNNANQEKGDNQTTTKQTADRTPPIHVAAVEVGITVQVTVADQKERVATCAVKRDILMCHSNRPNNKINHIATTKEDNSTPESEGEDIFVFKVGKDQPLFPVKISSSTVNVLIDSGASVNVLDEQTFHSIIPKPTLKPSKTKIYSFLSQNPLSTILPVLIRLTFFNNMQISSKDMLNLKMSKSDYTSMTRSSQYNSQLGEYPGTLGKKWNRK